VADTVLPALAARTPRADHTDARRLAASFGLRTVAVLYVGGLVLVPVLVILYRTFHPGLAAFLDALKDPNAQHAFQVTAIVAGSAVVINTVFGIAVALLLARYRFPGRRLLSAFIDLPIAVSPIVVGLALVLVFGTTGWFGPFLERNGVPVIGAKPGMILATAFVSLPLVVRAIVPVLEQTGMDQEQAAASLGANALDRFRRITLPTIRVALTYGVVLSLARCIGEYGAVLVVSNNIEGVTETAPLRISNLVENEQNTTSAYAVTFVLMMIAFVAILVSAWIRRRQEQH
jgi:sulfate transport system permease protein